MIGLRHGFAIKVAALLAFAATSVHPAAAQRIVRTDGGQLRGSSKSEVDAFLGIPFAQPPLGDLRWREPRPARAWTGVRDATRMSAGCMQEPSPANSPPPYTAEFLAGPEISEDCLYLNVWAPRASRGRKPVIVFVHGGAFQAGSSAVPIYDGARLAQKGAVVVTVNYRLGVMGYLAHPQLTRESPLKSSGNYGLLDIVAALRWVRSNIARFGGDPANVTLSGQSAGAIATNQLLASPLAKGLFKRAIAQSGPTIGLKMAPLATVEQRGEAYFKRFGTSTLAQIRAKPAKEVFTTFRGPAHPMPPFFPLPVMDGSVVVSDPEMPTNPIVSKVPLIVGFNRDEFSAPATTAAKFVASVRTDFGVFADRALAAYPHASDAEASRSAGELGRDRQISALLNWAERRAASSGQQVYVYRFNHAYPGKDAARLGSFHTAEVPYIFGTLDDAAGPVTAEDRRVVAQMQARWMAFISRSDPSLPGSAWVDVAKAGWRIMELGDNPGQRPAMPAARLALHRDYLASKAK